MLLRDCATTIAPQCTYINTKAYKVFIFGFVLTTVSKFFIQLGGFDLMHAMQSVFISLGALSFS
jgi:hypothetical protein